MTFDLDFPVKFPTGAVDTPGDNPEAVDIGDDLVLPPEPALSMLASLKRLRLGRDKAEPRGTLRVLVVDDEEPVRRFVGRVLKEGGYETMMAADGPDAIAVAQKEMSFDILVTDVMMPQMSGDELARRMRQIEPGLKILYLTGYSDRLFKEKTTLWQDEAFLDKPCSVKGLLQAVSLLTVGRISSPRIGS